MSQPSEKITKFLIVFVIGVFIIKGLSGAGFLEAKSHKGKGYFVLIPEGWMRVKKEKGVIYPRGVEIVQFIPKGIDLEIEEPGAFISIYSKKLDAPIWIEDEFPNIVMSLRKEGFDVKDKGDIKINEKIGAWVVYLDHKIPKLNLEFYMVSDNGMFYKIQYSADPDKFSKYRYAIEELKASFKFKFSL